MNATLDTLRRRYPEINPRRVHATSACFMDSDFFHALHFLYPAIKLSDGRIIPISQILNTPNCPTLTLDIDDLITLPTPDAAFAN
jgi:hypothetical protein